MDIAKPEKSAHWKRPLFAAGIALVLLALAGAVALQPQSLHRIERSQLLVGTVQRGDLEIEIDGYGLLRSNRQTLITALTAATVEEVVLRPGARVEKDSIILELGNPELTQQLEAAATAVGQEEASLRRLELSNQRDLLAEQATLAELSANLQVIRLRREAEQKLVANGVVPQISYKTTVLQQQQMQQRVQLQERRIDQLKKVSRESRLIQREQVNQAKAHYQNIKRRAEHLTVRAGMQGVLQRLPVELGQSVAAGQELALVGSDSDLVALVQVSQSRAEQLQIGQSAEIDTRREQVPGTVTRIAPGVRDGSVEVEIAFSGEIPDSARPELNVDARILVDTLSDALFIERPVNARSRMDSYLFKLEENGDRAHRQQIRFGEDSGRYIQLLSGAAEQDHFILSDTAGFGDAERLRIID